MQYTYELRFTLQGAPSESLAKFVTSGEANIVLPSQTIGGNLTSHGSNFHQQSLRIPLLKKHITFSATDTSEVLKCNMVIYNFACSMSSFLIVHSLSTTENRFVIQLISDHKKDIDFLKAIEERFQHVKEAEG